MPNIPNYNLQPTFPIASVIDAAQRNNALQLQAQQAGQQSLVAGLQSIGQIGQSLYQRKLQMAQALSGAKMFAQSPEGQQMLAPTTTTTTAPQAITQNQTAAYDPTTGSVTPNAAPTTAPLSPIATIPKTTTISSPSPVTMNDLQTAFMGESPSNMLTQLFQRQKERQEFGLKSQNQAFEQQFKPQQLQSQENVAKTLAGIKSTEVSNTNKASLRSAIAAQQARQQDAIKNFPGLAGTIASGILPPGLNAQQTAAFNDYKDAQNQIDDYNRQLQGTPTLTPKHMSTAQLLQMYSAATQGQQP